MSYMHTITHKFGADLNLRIMGGAPCCKRPPMPQDEAPAGPGHPEALGMVGQGGKHFKPGHMRMCKSMCIPKAHWASP